MKIGVNHNHGGRNGGIGTILTTVEETEIGDNHNHGALEESGQSWRNSDDLNHGGGDRN